MRSSTGTLRSWRSVSRVASSASFASRSIGVQLADQRQHLRGALLVGVLRIVELAARMGPAGDFRHASALIDPVVTAVGVGLQVTCEVLQPLRRAVAACGSACSRRRCTGWRRRRGSTRCGPCGIASGPATGPARSCRRCGSPAIAERARSSTRPAARPTRRPPHPGAHRAAGDVDLLTLEDVFQPVQRQVIAQLAHDHVGQQARPRQPLVDRLRRLGGRCDVRVVAVVRRTWRRRTCGGRASGP